MTDRRLRICVIFAVSLCILPPQYLASQDYPLASERDGGGDADDIPESGVAPEEEEPTRLLLALSEEGYPVTPGDVYELIYHTPSLKESMLLTVQSDYSMDLQVFGELNASGFSYSALRRRIVQIVSDAFPRSSPSLNLKSIGYFNVVVRGAVRQTKSITAWGLSRLSETVEDIVMPYSSLRDVEVMSRNGNARSYDLFRALNQGFVEEDPFVKPGDTVTVKRKNRKVELRGEVYNPGTFDVLARESLTDLIVDYGHGFLPISDTSRINIQRAAADGLESFHVDLDSAAGFRFEDGDIVTVPSKRSQLAAVYIEGGILPLNPAGRGETIDSGSYNREWIQFVNGDTLYDVLNGIRDRISPSALLEQGRIEREAESLAIEVNLADLLYRYSPSKDIKMEPFDRIVIPVPTPPVTEFSVSIRGAVEQAATVTVSDGTRLSEVLIDALTPISSIRGVEVVSQDGESNYYDMFAPLRRGSVEEDPILRPGQTIIVRRRQFTVEILGEVTNPGTFELTESEGLEALLVTFAEGFTAAADTARLKIRRSTDVGLETIHIDYETEGSSFTLKKGDVVTVPSKADKLAAVYVEGGILADGPGLSGEYAIERIPFAEGDTLYDVMSGVRDRISPFAVLENGQVERESTQESFVVNLEKLLFRYSADDDIPLEPLDRIIIPVHRPFVAVHGAVNSPGEFAYAPGQRYMYYLSLAGGIDPERNKGAELTIYNADGSEKGDETIAPGDSIVVHTNSFVYNFNRYFPIISSSLAFVSAVVSLVLTFSQ